MYTCAITGHRPTRFKWKYGEDDNRFKRLKKRLYEQFSVLYGQGVRRFLVGGALGVDMWSGEILLKMKLEPEYQEIELVMVLPYSGHDKRWDERSKHRLAFLMRHITEHIVVGRKPWRESFIQRNRYLVDHANCLLAVYDNDNSIRSGTGATVHYAEKKGLPIIFIHPDTAKVSYEGLAIPSAE